MLTFDAQAVYQSLLHLTWIDDLLENIKTIFLGLYKEQLKGSRSRVANYPFDKYFEQQLRELDQTTELLAEDKRQLGVESKRDALTKADTGGPPPPPVPGFLTGETSFCILQLSIHQLLTPVL